MKNGISPVVADNGLVSELKLQDRDRVSSDAVSDFAKRILEYSHAIEHPSTATTFIDFLRMIPRAAKQGWNRSPRNR
jgi:hypothetical protein